MSKIDLNALKKFESDMETYRQYHLIRCNKGLHQMEFLGGCNTGCDEFCICSTEIFECKICNHFEYGEIIRSKHCISELFKEVRNE